MYGKKPKAARLAYADHSGRRIERIFDREEREVAIRFSVWTAAGKIALRPMAMPEDDLLVLIGDAMAAGVFSAAFVEELRAICLAQSRR